MIIFAIIIMLVIVCLPVQESSSNNNVENNITENQVITMLPSESIMLQQIIK